MMLDDICFDCNGVRFNYRVSCIICADGKYLLHRRKGDTFWNLIGGRVSMGESSLEAVRREIREEIGCNCEIDGLVSVSENFFRFRDTDFHEILMTFCGTLKEEIQEVGIEKDMELRWFTCEDLDKIEIRPEFTIKMIRKAGHDIQRIINEERE